MQQQRTLRPSELFMTTLPVGIGYIFMGLSFGLLFALKGGNWAESLAASLTAFAGSAQFLSIEFYRHNFEIWSMIVALFILNLRHLFYGLSELKTFGRWGLKKIYLICTLTDENFGMIQLLKKQGACTETNMCRVFFINQMYWALSCSLGAWLGPSLDIQLKGLDFALSALFLILFLENVKTMVHAQRSKRLG